MNSNLQKKYRRYFAILKHTARSLVKDKFLERYCEEGNYILLCAKHSATSSAKQKPLERRCGEGEKCCVYYFFHCKLLTLFSNLHVPHSFIQLKVIMENERFNSTNCNA